MKKFSCVIRKFWLLILGGIILWLAFVFYRPFEPHYRGKPLSAWAVRVYWSSEHDAAVDAIQHIGTNALPYAIKFCSTKDFAIKDKLLEWVAARQSGETTLGQIILSSEKLIPPDISTQSKGVAIFEALGPMAKPAIPNLVKLLEDKKSGVANAAADSLTRIGHTAIPSLIEALTNQNQFVQFYAVRSLKYMKDTTGNFKIEIRPAIPILVVRLSDDNPRMRQSAAAALEKFQVDEPIVVPALIEALKRETNFQSPEFMFDSWGFMRAIGSFHTNAQMAVSVLVGIIKNDPSGRANEALKTLQQIAPEIAEPYIQKFNSALTNPPPDDSVSNLFYNYYGTGNRPNMNTDRLPSALPATAN